MPISKVHTAQKTKFGISNVYNEIPVPLHSDRLMLNSAKEISIVNINKKILKIVSGVYEKENATEAFEAISHNDGTLAKLLIKFEA